MKKLLAKYLSLLLLVAVPFTSFAAFEKNVPFNHVTYYASASGTGDASGRSYASAKAMVDGDVFAIPAGAVIEKVYVIVDEAITGTTNLQIGDDDAAGGYASAGTVTMATPGMKDGATRPQAKYYSESGKEVKVDFTGSNDDGQMRVIVEGYLHVQ
jgi:hypothetical protein